MSPYLLNVLFVNLIPILKRIVNASLTGLLPSPWKRAIILSKLKKLNLDPVLSNYSPLSNLTFISKLTEKAASIQVVNHLALHDLVSRTQSAYRKHYSTELRSWRLQTTSFLIWTVNMSTPESNRPMLWRILVHGLITPSRCLHRLVKLPPHASTPSIISGELGSISQRKSVKP